VSSRLKALLRRPIAAIAGLALRLTGLRAGVAIVYHRVGDPHQPFDGTVLNPSLGTRRFEAHLRHLKSRYRVVPASELLGAVHARKRGQRFPVAVTFDDDWPSHVRTAMPILARVGVPATFFVCGASLSGVYPFWWDRLERAQARGALDQARLRALVPASGADSGGGSTMLEIAIDIEEMPPRDREALSEELGRLAGPDPEDATLATSDLRALVSSGLEVGFHTLRHHNLTQLDDDELRIAMVEGRDRIAEAIGHELTTIAYPHGRCDDRVLRAARRAGYRFGFTTEPQPVLPDTDPLGIGRLDPLWALTQGHFALAVLRVLLRGRGRDQAPAS
jgi:peptidoglycan/xylan/chitin deacetylase (PgdA/CDA1 family)